jgi:hypothetical protein
MTNQNQKAFAEKIVTSIGALLEQQLGHIRGEFAEHGETLRGEIAEQGKTLRGEIAEQGKTLRGEIAEQGKTLRGEIAEQGKTLHAEITRINRQLAKHIVDINDLKDEVHAALDGAMSAVKHEDQLSNHDGRLNQVERDIKVVKAVLKKNNSTSL